MAKKIVVVSDITGNDIPDGEVQSVVVKEYPGLSEPVKLDAAKDETAKLRQFAKQYVLLEITETEGATEHLAIDLEALKKTIKGDADEIIRGAERVYVPPQPALVPAPTMQRRPRSTGPAVRSEKLDYSDVRFAGRVKRGIVSEAEKQTVRDHFDEVNENLAAAGQRTLDLSNIEHVTKYGLDDLAKARGITPGPSSG